MDWSIEGCIIFEGVTGSQAYGTSDELSDVDRRGVCIPPLSVLLGFQNFDQKDGWEGKYEDRVIYNLKKFFLLVGSNNSKNNIRFQGE